MSRTEYLGTSLDRIFRGSHSLQTSWRVSIWNPHRTTLGEVVRGEARSPEYDLTNWLVRGTLTENTPFENSDDAVVGRASLEFVRDPDASPIGVDELTLIDGAPIRIWLGDASVDSADWVPVFSGILTGDPTFRAREAAAGQPQTVSVQAVDRAGLYLRRHVLSRSYDRGQDLGKMAVEMAIEELGLQRREVLFGWLGQAVAHHKAQIVDVAALVAIAQVLAAVGKKPRFDGLGRLVAADTDFDRAAVRRYDAWERVLSADRQPSSDSANSVRALGVDSAITRIIQPERRLAHGSLTAGFFDTAIDHYVAFSENRGEPEGGRRAIETRADFDEATLGDFLFGDGASWVPEIAEDGTTFGGRIQADTYYEAGLRSGLIYTYVATQIAISQLDPVSDAVALRDLQMSSALTMAAILLTMTELGRLDFEIFGRPVTEVYQQLAAVAELQGVTTENRRQVEWRNDLVGDIDILEARAKALLRRELAKGQAYTVETIVDPLVEVDDIVQFGDERYYVASIERDIVRGSATQRMTCWRIR